MLLALFLTGFGTFLNLNAPQPLLPLFRQLFHASELWVSLTVTAPALSMALTVPLAWLVADVLGRKRVIVVAMIGVALPSVLLAAARALTHLILWRFLQRIFIPGIAAVAMAHIGEESPGATVGASMVTYVTGTVIGGLADRFMNALVTPH